MGEWQLHTRVRVQLAAPRAVMTVGDTHPACEPVRWHAKRRGDIPPGVRRC